MELVNIVSTGEIDCELDLNTLTQDIDVYSIDYSPDTFPAAIIKTNHDTPTISLFRTGKFTITGAENKKQIEESLKEFEKSLKKLGIISSQVGLEAKVVNRVYSAEVRLDLDFKTLSIVLGVENTEYEPEISPFVVYRPEDTSCVITISSSGSIVITGITSERTAQSGLKELKNRIENHSGVSST